MRQLFQQFLIMLFVATNVAAQSPSPSVTPAARALIDSMNSSELEQAVQLIRNNYVDPRALDDTEVDRAKLEGVLERLGRGAILLPDSATQNSGPAGPFYNDLLAGHVAYFRLGDLTRENLQAFDTALGTLPGKKADALVVDLRASGGTNDFETAAEFAKRICPKGKTLFTLRKAA